MKKAFIGIFTLVVAFSLVAFVAPSSTVKEKKTLTTYVYTGDNSLEQQREEQWYVKEENPQPCSGNAQRICLIVMDTDHGETPDFSNGNPVDDPEEFEDIEYKPFQ